MIPESLVAIVALCVPAAVVTVWLLVLGHGLWSYLLRSRRARVARAHAVLTDALLERSIGDDGRKMLRRLPRWERFDLFAAVATHLRGAEREWLSGLAANIGIVARARRLCRGLFWWDRLYGVRILTVVGGGEDFVLKLARDRNALVRSEVAEWAGTYPAAEGIRTLTTMLDDPSHASRFSVQDALVRVGGEAVEPLAERLGGLTDPPAAIAGLTVARGLGDPRLLEPVLGLSQHAVPEVRRAAYQALGTTGGQRAADRLVEGLEDPDPSARAAAVTALGWLAHWKASSAVARQLSDRSWDVRLAAGRALVAMGAPGELMLRNVPPAAGAFAADMARHVMDVYELDGGSAA